MKKKIIFVSTALWIGGIEIALVNMLKEFDYSRYDVTLLIVRAELDLINQVDPRCKIIIADRENIYSFTSPYKYKKLYHLTEDTRSPSRLHKLFMWSVPIIKYLENRLWILYIKQQMKEYKFDTCIIYSDVTAEIAIKSISAKKYIMFYHHGAMRHVYHDTIGYKKCSNIIAVSSIQAEKIKKFVPWYADKVITIHNLIDVQGIREKASRPLDVSFSERNFNIVSVGRISHEKGMDLAVKACAELVRRGYKNIHWWIVGGGPAEDEVRETITETGMDKYVTMVGMKNNPYPYIIAADLYVQPSRFEGYPMTILESLVLGQPVVSTDNGGAREIFQQWDVGILCKLKISDIANKIEGLINSPDLIARYRSMIYTIDFYNENEKYIRQLGRYL